MARQLALLCFAAVLVVACTVDRATASAGASSGTTTTTSIPALPTRATTPTMVYGVIPNAQWIECGRAWLWVTEPGLERPISITQFERRIVRDRLAGPFLAVTFAIEQAHLVDATRPRGVVNSIATRPPEYPRMVRAWTNVARACRALVVAVSEQHGP